MFHSLQVEVFKFPDKHGGHEEVVVIEQPSDDDYEQSNLSSGKRQRMTSKTNTVYINYSRIITKSYLYIFEWLITLKLHAGHYNPHSMKHIINNF